MNATDLLQHASKKQSCKQFAKKAAICLVAGLFLTTSQLGFATNQPAAPETEAKTEPKAETADPATTAADATNSDTTADASAAAPEEAPLTAAVVSPQVEKLMALYPRLIARIEPFGKVCFSGGECDITITALSASADGGPRDGQTIYNAICQTCHAGGLMGAPKYGNAGDWGPRIAKGKATLYDHAIHGYNAMPAKGGADILDEEVQNAVDYMVSKI